MTHRANQSACADCPTPLSPRNVSGRCRACAARVANADPANRARRLAALRAKLGSPEHAATQRAAAARREEQRRDDPAWHAYKVASGRRLRRQYEASSEGQAKNAAARASVGAKISDTRLPWCPRPYRAEYQRLRKIMLAADARRVIEEQIARDERNRLAAMTPLERQLEALRNGARLVAKPILRAAEPTFTLGGIATGMF